METYTTAPTIGQILQSLLKGHPPKVNSPIKIHALNSPISCHKCQGLDHCPYSNHKGMKATTIKGKGNRDHTVLKPCRYLLEERAKIHLANLHRESNIPNEYRKLTFDDLKIHSGNEEAIAAARKLESTYFYGASNTGKTSLLSAIGNKCLRQGKPTRYTTAAELLLELRYNTEDCQECLRRLQEVPVLLIDDLGLEHKTPYSEEQIYLVIEGRLRNGNLTMIAARRSLDDWGDRYNDYLIKKIARLTNQRKYHLKLESRQQVVESK